MIFKLSKHILHILSIELYLMPQAKNPHILYNKVDPKKVHFTEKDKKINVKSQYIHYPRYGFGEDERQFIMETPWIMLEQYGFPKLGDFYTEDNQRNFVKLPLNKEYKESAKLHSVLSELDEHIKDQIADIIELPSKKKMSKEKIKEKLDKKMLYNPLVKKPKKKNNLLGDDDDDDDDDDKKKDQDEKVRYDSLKVKLDIDYNTQKVKTQVYIRENKKRRKVNVEKISDLDNYFKFRCKMRCILQANKLYVLKNDNADGKIPWGMTFKLRQVEIVPPEGISSREKFEEFAFLEDDLVEEEEKQNNNEEKSKADEEEDSDEEVKADKEDEDKTEDDDSDEDEDEEEDKTEDDDSEDEEVSKKKTKKTKSRTKTK